jgi:hypothetical protein
MKSWYEPNFWNTRSVKNDFLMLEFAIEKEE